MGFPLKTETIYELRSNGTNLSLGQMIAAELTHEAISTRKMLERVPTEKLTWKPHEKSMTLERSPVISSIWSAGQALRSNITNLIFRRWITTESLHGLGEAADFDKNLAESIEILNNTPNETFGDDWTMRNGEQIYFTMPKAA